jgi:hypothetical protein
MFLALVYICWPLGAPFEGFAGYEVAPILYGFITEWFGAPVQATARGTWISRLGLLHVFSPWGTVDSYIAMESPIAKAGVLANIGPNGTRSMSAKVSRRAYYYVQMNIYGLET